MFCCVGRWRHESLLKCDIFYLILHRYFEYMYIYIIHMLYTFREISSDFKFLFIFSYNYIYFYNFTKYCIYCLPDNALHNIRITTCLDKVLLDY